MNPTNDNGAHSFTEGATFETTENINEFLKEEKTMEAIYLQSMTDFVLKVVQTPNINEAICWEQTEGRLNKIYEYSLFLKQPLQLGFFVPCDENGNVLEEPKRWNDYLQFPDSFDGNKEWGELYNYELAQERVMFKGFKHYLFMQADNIKHNKSRKCFSLNYNGVIIEDLISLEVELTETAIKQIGL